ncbi:xanthine dehydrogenase family protein subunit M [Aquabacter sp. CN5-332]|uniref:FAD binding domain-containing protein n=1 Tax=Aquabacter sp. CN5-332 TaxID=3156608 RepID=UPI0032B39E70
MKPAAFAYHTPASKAELLSLLSELEDARVIAGGQSLMPMMNLRLAAPSHLIDLNSLPELGGIAQDGDTLVIGAMTRQREAERSPLVARVCPLLRDALEHVGFQQTRNRGTVGGSIAHMDPTAELPVVASALDGVLIIESVRGVRRVPMGEFSVGYLATQVEPDEVLVRIELPLWPEGHGWGFEEVTRRGENFSVVCVAALVLLDGAGRISRAAIAVGGLAAAPVRLTEAEAVLTGAVPSEEAISAAAAFAGELEADDALFVPPDFKQHLARVLTTRALRSALERAGSQVHA